MDASLLDAVRVSLGVALLAAVLGLPPAVGLGWLLARKRFVGRTALGVVLLAPLVLPPVVTGFLLLRVLGRDGPLAFLELPFTLWAAVLAALVVGLPLYVVSARNAFEAVDPRYEELSHTLGVRPRRTFVRVTLPLALPGIAAGAVLAFARALGEFGATIVLAGNVEGETRTIALAVYTLLETPGGDDGAAVLSAASIALALFALVAYEALGRRQRRRLGERDE
jgi:molybdate transport system permease protein